MNEKKPTLTDDQILEVLDRRVTDGQAKGRRERDLRINPEPDPVFCYRTDIPKESALFIGMLRCFPTKKSQPPGICVVSWCHCCHKRHTFRWKGDIPQTPDSAVCQVSRCTKGPLVGSMVYVALNPGRPAMDMNLLRYSEWKNSYESWVEKNATCQEEAS